MRTHSSLHPIAIKGLAASSLILSLILSPVTANAGDLAEIYDLAVNNDPQLGAARASYLATAEVIPQARAGLLPVISLGATTSDNKRTTACSLH